MAELLQAYPIVTALAAIGVATIAVLLPALYLAILQYAGLAVGLAAAALLFAWHAVALQGHVEAERDRILTLQQAISGTGTAGGGVPDQAMAERTLDAMARASETADTHTRAMALAVRLAGLVVIVFFILTIVARIALIWRRRGQT